MNSTERLILPGLQPIWLELAQEPEIVSVEMAYVVNTIFQHGDPLWPHSESESSVLLRVVTHTFQYFRVDHPGAHNLYPSTVSADSTSFTVTYTGEAIN